MAGTAIEIGMLKQLLRLYEQGQSIKSISRALGMSKNTVRHYLRRIASRGDDVTELLSLNNEVLAHLLRGRDVADSKLHELTQLFPDISAELEKTGFTLHRLWCRYKASHPEGYQYSQFCYYYRRYRKSKQPTMHFEHEAEDKLFIDYAGKVLSYVQYGTGKVIECEFFVAVLGYSQYTYAESSHSQRKEDFITGVQNALHYFGGVPKVLVPDNLKSAVTGSSRYEPCLNEDFLDMANHYQCAVMPARSYKPRDKSLVENHVRILYTRVHAELSALTFFSLSELNRAILVCIEKHNGMFFQGKSFSRKQSFEGVEIQTLQPLPQERYEIKRTGVVTVMKNAHIQLSEDKH